MHHVPKLQKALGYKNRLYFVETAVMTNFDVTEFVGSRKMSRNVAGLGNIAGSGCKPRHVAAKISPDPDCEPVFVTCCHLHYKAEPTRMAEVAWMEDDLKQLFTDNCCQIWTGDFNSLTREDYDDVTWESIAKIRCIFYPNRHPVNAMNVAFQGEKIFGSHRRRPLLRR